jgi:di/tricarboxylate transporter
MAEVVIRPGSRWIGQRLREVSFRARYHVSVFAILRHGAHLREKIGRVTLRMGDVLLVQGTPDAIQGLRVLDDLILVDEVRHHLHRKERGPVALGVMAAVVVLASLGVLPVAVLAFAGALLVILTRCVTRKEAYASIDWSIIALIGGTIALGRAMDATHAARVLVETVLGWVARWSGGLDPRMVTLAALFVLTNAATEVMSNAAAAALLTPLAIAAAESFGIDPRPFVVTVAFAASCSFATPIGYQTNTFVYGPGGYRFTDFARVGLPLNVAVFVLAALLIPVLWPFESLA